MAVASSNNNSVFLTGWGQPGYFMAMWMATAWLAPEKNLTFVAVSNVADARAVDSAFSTTIPVYAK